MTDLPVPVERLVVWLAGFALLAVPSLSYAKGRNKPVVAAASLWASLLVSAAAVTGLSYVHSPLWTSVLAMAGAFIISACLSVSLLLVLVQESREVLPDPYYRIRTSVASLHPAVILIPGILAWGTSVAWVVSVLLGDLGTTEVLSLSLAVLLPLSVASVFLWVRGQDKTGGLIVMTTEDERQSNEAAGELARLLLSVDDETIARNAGILFLSSWPPQVGAAALRHTLSSDTIAVSEAAQGIVDEIECNEPVQKRLAKLRLSFQAQLLRAEERAWANSVRQDFKAVWDEWQSQYKTGWRIKRAIDVATSGVLLAVLGPVIPLLALLKGSDEPIFATLRFGYRARPFTYYLINVSQDEDSSQFVDSVVALSALDLLPALTNIMAGEMSLVGPHPLYSGLLDFLQREWEEGGGSDSEMPCPLLRLGGPPGVTGRAKRATRSGRVGRCIDFAREDVEYLQGWSLRSDLALLGIELLLYSPVIVLRGVGSAFAAKVRRWGMSRPAVAPDWRHIETAVAAARADVGRCLLGLF